MPRIGREEWLMEQARLFALRSTCLRGQVGCVAVREGKYVISGGYNGAPPGLTQCDEVGCDLGNGRVFRGQYVMDGVAVIEDPHVPVGAPPVALPEGLGCQRATHAEANCIAHSARMGASLRDAEMYCTHACCATCAALVVAAGIVKVTYDKPYRLPEGLELLDKANVEVVRWTSS